MGISIETMAWCADYWATFTVPSSNGKGTYIVQTNGGEAPSHCTCPAFRYSKELPPTCKHIEAVWKQGCFYNPQWHDGNPSPTIRPDSTDFPKIEGKTCICGGPMVWVRCAV